MRMKFNRPSQLMLLSVASLMVATLVTACGTLTTDFVFVTSSKAAGTNNYGEINVFEINSESGFMRQIPTSPFPSDGRNPVAEAVAPDNQNLYVVNRDDNTIVQFNIGNDGKLYPHDTVNTPGIFPMAVAVNGSNLFVLDTFQPLPLCSTAQPCSGSIAVYNITSGTAFQTDGELSKAPIANGNLTYWPLTGANASHVIVPTGVNVLKSGAEVYVSAYDSTASIGYVFGFAVGSGGVLTPVPGSPFAVGTHPSAVASDGSSSYIYVTDSITAGKVHAFTVASNGALTEIVGSPFAAGSQPSAIVVDSAYPYAYVANQTDGTVSGYTILSAAGTCNGVSVGVGALCSVGSSTASTTGSFPVGQQPVAIGIDASTHHFLFTANYLGNSVSGFEIVTSGTGLGSLINSQYSPYTSNAQPTAAVAVPHNVPGVPN
jgi:6-phosphogluconolactonase (cycloisomerase 2 family)